MAPNQNIYVGRESEHAEFRQLLKKRKASLVTCQGRRRIGKSTFIRKCSEEMDHFISIDGLAPRKGLGKTEQLNSFSLKLSQQSRLPPVGIATWSQAFQLLASAIPSDGRTLVLLDEISWMATGDADFAGQLKSAWDQEFSQQDGLVVFLCGSVSSWIEENILNSTGFVGRCSWQFNLDALPLWCCNAFWPADRRQAAAAEKLKILSITGGVPRYLEEIDPGQSAEQNIHRLCFNPSGLLFNEFEQIFHDIFGSKATTHRIILEQLVSGPKSVSQIGDDLGNKRGGSLSLRLKELEQARFIARDISFNPSTGTDLPRIIRYRLSDNYMRFYLKYVAPHRSQIEKKLYRHVPLESMQAWNTLIGLQFENLVLNNISGLLAQMGLSNTPILNAGPHYQTQTKAHESCQIDLMLRSKETLYVFEVKFRKRINISVAGDLTEKISRLKLPRSVSVRSGLIYQGELPASLRDTDRIDFLLPFEQLLRKP
jgi:AAA+ ATPase superfamily predicted ATPase